MLFPLKMESFHQLGGIYMKINMTEATAWARITAYMAENRLNTTFEAESQQNMAVEAKIEEHENKETRNKALLVQKMARNLTLGNVVRRDNIRKRLAASSQFTTFQNALI